MLKRSNNAIGSGTGRFGVYRLDEYTENIRNKEAFYVPGQAEWLDPGSYTWVCPEGVTSVCAVCIGGGGGGYSSWANSAGGGGGLGWKNSIPVTPGQAYTVVVGAGGGRNGAGTGWTGGNSYFISLGTVAGYGGGNATVGAYTNGANQNGAGGGWVGDGGGAGGNANYQGGGGAGGYAGNGGFSTSAAPAGGGGAGGGYYSSTFGTGGGGGTGIYGQRTDYNARTSWTYGTTTARGTTATLGAVRAGFGGEGGSTRTGVVSGVTTGAGGFQGENGQGQGYNANNIGGGWPGGGGGGPGTSAGGGGGGGGAVRLIWSGEVAGLGRGFPTTLTEDIV